jgi:septal ring factor EnvC (AmiA/AmiB activator)
MTDAPETQDQAQQPEPTAISLSSGKSILGLAVFALGLNAAAAVYTLSPSDFALPDVSQLAQLLPHQKAPDPKPDPVLVALQEIQAAQQKHVAALQENNSSLQQSAALQQQDSDILGSLRQGIRDEKVDVKKISAQITDQHVDVKKMSAQISKLIAKVESLQNALAPELTSSTRNRLSGELRKGVGQSKPVVGETPKTAPAATSNED